MRKEIYRQITYVVLGCLLAYGATWGVNQLFHFGGPFDRLERLNPLFVQEVEPIPQDATKYFYWESQDFGQAATLVVQNNEVTLEGIEGRRPRRTSQQFLRPLPATGYRVFVQRLSGRGMIIIVQQPTKENRYAAKIKIEDPYGEGSDYKLSLYFQPVESAQ
jgi:hypothetical protein